MGGAEENYFKNRIQRELYCEKKGWKCMQSIRGLLNKVGTTNTRPLTMIFLAYLILYSVVICLLKRLCRYNNTIDLLSHDSFFVDIYASLFSLHDKYILFADLFEQMDNYIETFNNIIMSIQTMTMIYFGL